MANLFIQTEKALQKPQLIRQLSRLFHGSTYSGIPVLTDHLQRPSAAAMSTQSGTPPGDNDFWNALSKSAKSSPKKNNSGSKSPSKFSSRRKRKEMGEDEVLLAEKVLGTATQGVGEAGQGGRAIQRPPRLSAKPWESSAAFPDTAAGHVPRSEPAAPIARPATVSDLGSQATFNAPNAFSFQDSLEAAHVHKGQSHTARSSPKQSGKAEFGMGSTHFPVDEWNSQPYARAAGLRAGSQTGVEAPSSSQVRAAWEYAEGGQSVAQKGLATDGLRKRYPSTEVQKELNRRIKNSTSITDLHDILREHGSGMNDIHFDAMLHSAFHLAVHPPAMPYYSPSSDLETCSTKLPRKPSGFEPASQGDKRGGVDRGSPGQMASISSALAAYPDREKLQRLLDDIYRLILPPNAPSSASRPEPEALSSSPLESFRFRPLSGLLWASVRLEQCARHVRVIDAALDLLCRKGHDLISTEYAEERSVMNLTKTLWVLGNIPRHAETLHLPVSAKKVAAQVMVDEAWLFNFWSKVQWSRYAAEAGMNPSPVSAEKTRGRDDAEGQASQASAYSTASPTKQLLTAEERRICVTMYRVGCITNAVVDCLVKKFYGEGAPTPAQASGGGAPGTPLSLDACVPARLIEENPINIKNLLCTFSNLRVVDKRVYKLLTLSLVKYASELSLVDLAAAMRGLNSIALHLRATKVIEQASSSGNKKILFRKERANPVVNSSTVAPSDAPSEDASSSFALTRPEALELHALLVQSAVEQAMSPSRDRLQTSCQSWIQLVQAARLKGNNRNEYASFLPFAWETMILLLDAGRLREVRDVEAFVVAFSELGYAPPQRQLRAFVDRLTMLVGEVPRPEEPGRYVPPQPGVDAVVRSLTAWDKSFEFQDQIRWINDVLYGRD